MQKKTVKKATKKRGRAPQAAPSGGRDDFLSVVHISPELAPIAKVGGLGDVVLGLGRELLAQGHQLEVILPKYDCMCYDPISDLEMCYKDLWVPWCDGAIHCSVFQGCVNGLRCYFIEPHSGEHFFDRGTIYGHDDDVLRFAFFSKAAMEFLFHAQKKVDIIHCHDWQTALVPVLLYEIYERVGMQRTRVCLTIHNFKHQGQAGPELLEATGLKRKEYFYADDRLRDNYNPFAINLLKGGIVYSNFVTTVSPKHAWEAKDQAGGFGLEPALHRYHMKYGGIINGIDYDTWNPETDPFIPTHYSVEDLQPKYENKRALREQLGLVDNEKPIIAFVGRLDPQKGLDLVRHALFHSMYLGGQFVLLGSSPESGINAYFSELKKHIKDSQDCHIEIGFDEPLAHQIYAGADMMIVPSRYEPCGLTQLIAMRYGTIPIVRSCGGLADTVFDVEASDRPIEQRNGYVFINDDNAGVEAVLERAVSAYYESPESFRETIIHAMRSDYSWKEPAKHYINIYRYIRDK